MSESSVDHAVECVVLASRCLDAAAVDARTAGRRGELPSTAAIALEQSAEQVAGLADAIEAAAVVATA
jgi:hypothetical protein